MASSVAAAPMAWPKAPFMELTGTTDAREPRTRRRAPASMVSLSGVEVPYALAREGPEAVEAAQHEAAQDIVTARDHRVGLPAPQKFGAQSKRSGPGGA